MAGNCPNSRPLEVRRKNLGALDDPRSPHAKENQDFIEAKTSSDAITTLLRFKHELTLIVCQSFKVSSE